MSADTLCWTDIPVTNLDRAIKFYSAVFGKAALEPLRTSVTESGLYPTTVRRVMQPGEARAHITAASGVGNTLMAPARTRERNCA
jgi:hypothetical protein